MLTYLQRNSLGHSSDPRVKIIWVVVLMGIMFSTRTIEMAELSLIIALFACVFSSVSFSEVFPKPRFLAFILAMPFLFGYFFVSPQYGIINSAILLSALTMPVLFILTTERKAIVAALRFFKLPPSTAFSLALSLHFLPVFEKKFDLVRVAQSSRGYSGKNPIPLAVPLMHSVLRKTKSLSTSLDARAFDPDRIPMPYDLKMKTMDWFALLVLGGLVLARIYYF